MICWKIRIFAYWTTPGTAANHAETLLWFAEKFVSLLIEQHRRLAPPAIPAGCDLLKNSYLCLLNNTPSRPSTNNRIVVICWKIRIFAYWTTPVAREEREEVMLWFAEKFVSLLIEQHHIRKIISIAMRCDLLKNSYLCLLNNTRKPILVV